MSDDIVRPRRALAPDDSAEASEASEGLVENPFARPGSEASREPLRARRSLPPEDEQADEAFSGSDDDTMVVDRVADPEPMIPAPVLPDRGEGFFDGPGPKPRRSALSSSTPPEAWSAEPAADDATPPSPTSPTEVTAADDEPARPWYRAHLPALLVSGLAVALMTGGAWYGGRELATPAADESASPSPSPSPSSTVQIPRVSQTDLMTEADAKAIAPGAVWAITGTTESLEAHQSRPACLSTSGDAADRLDSLQRTIGTTEDNQLALLHQLDAFPSEESASEVFAARARAMASCSEIQVRLVSAASVEGLADEAAQITVVEETGTNKFHNLLLTRTGNVLSMVDAVANGKPVETGKVVEAMGRSATALCEETGSECDPSAATVSSAALPTTDPKGWLVPSDLPRMRPGVGLWTMQEPAALSSKGIGCEDMTLASENGPTERQQATYLLTQDDQRPDEFGLDQMVFRFPDEERAAAFAKKLVGGLSSCGKRVLGTEVKTLESSAGNAFEITRKTDTDDVTYEIAIVRRGNAVSYLLATVTPEYRFRPDMFSLVAQRAADRLPQGAEE